MNQFEERVYSAFRAAIETWAQPLADQIYAISFFVYDDEDDPRYPTVTLGYNTTGRLREAVPSASDSAEAKWNYAFWLQNEECVIGRDLDSEDSRERLSWIRSLQLDYSDEDEEADFARAMALGRQITRRFVDLCVRVAQRLHHDEVIQAKFRRAVPIIVHELEYYEKIAAQTERANPPDVAAEFAAWVRSLR